MIVGDFYAKFASIYKKTVMKKLYFALGGIMAAASLWAQPMGMPKLLSPAELSDTPNETIIFQAPDGEKKSYVETYDGWVYWGSEMGLYYFSDFNASNHMIWGEDSKVYIYDPVKAYSTSSYAVGTYADGKIRVDLPQCIGAYTDNEGEEQFMWLNKMEEVEQDGEKYYMICYPEDNYVEYAVDEAGNITLDLGNDKEAIDIENGEQPKYLLAMTYENEPHALQVWSGFGDAFQNWEYVPYEEPVTPPAGLASEYWAFNTIGHEHLIEVKIDGNDIYMNGFSSYIEQFWIKGTLTPEKEIVFPTQQYMGMDEYDQNYYFLATKTIPGGEDEWNTYEMIDQITMKYDPETKVYSAPGECLCVSSYRNVIAYYALAEDPMLWQQDPESLNAAPENPEFISFSPRTDDNFEGSLVWRIPNKNVNGALLPTVRMYYNMYVDGELFTFEPDEYKLFDEPTTDVPYDASNFMDIFSYDQNFYISIRFFDPESFGMQSFYVAEDGTTYASELITANVSPSAVKGIENVAKVVSEQYFDLSGRSIATPAEGICIVKRTYSDGTVHTEKTIRR